MNQKGGKRPKWRVLDLEKETKMPEKKVEIRGYVVSPNYKRKSPMTRTQWRRYQRNKKDEKEAPTSQLKPVETSGQERQLPKGVWTKKGKIVSNQTITMIIDLVGRKRIVSSQSMKCSSQVENEKEPENTLQPNVEEPEYSPQSNEEGLEYSPQSDEDMYEDTNDDTYGEDFIVNYDIISVLHAEYDMVSEVSEAGEDFMLDVLEVNHRAITL